jgi:hypothetical protein
MKDLIRKIKMDNNKQDNNLIEVYDEMSIRIMMIISVAKEFMTDYNYLCFKEAVRKILLEELEIKEKVEDK